MKGSVPLGDAVTFHVPASVRRRYDKLTRFPDGFLVIGDGVCAFNPVYGQGMTVAAMEAVALAEHLDRGPVRPIQFFKELKPIVDVPWDISAGGDLAFPGVEGKRTAKVRMGNRYISRLHSAAQRDGRFTKAFFRVAGPGRPAAGADATQPDVRHLAHRLGQPEALSRARGAEPGGRRPVQKSGRGPRSL